MVKSVLGVNHQGLTEWKIQRVTAIYLAIYAIIFLGYLVCHPNLTFSEWQALFASKAMKIATILCLLAILYHAWIGIWTVFTDYVKPYILRAILDTLVILFFAACFIWGILILWSV